MISNLMMSLGKYAGNYYNGEDHDGYENESMLRHFVLNSIRSYNMKFKDEYGELVIACDDQDYWRKDIFPYYKANRKKDRESSDLDWSALFKSLNRIREELKETFPYRVIQIPRAEADDVIAALCERYGNTSEKILIISGDKDFKQLQSYMNVKQWDAVRGKWVIENNPEAYLKEHIMRGDGGDGIPNFLSPDDKYVANTRAKQLRATNLEKWIHMEPTEFCDENMLRGYRRNEALVDLSLIPEYIKESVYEEFDSQENKKAKNLLSYFMAHRLKNLTEVIGQFKVNRQ